MNHHAYKNKRPKESMRQVTSTESQPFQSFHRRLTGTKTSNSRVKYPNPVENLTTKRLKLQNDILANGVYKENSAFERTFRPTAETPKTSLRTIASENFYKGQGQMRPRSLNSRNINGSIVAPRHTFCTKKRRKKHIPNTQKAAVSKDRPPAFYNPVFQGIQGDSPLCPKQTENGQRMNVPEPVVLDLSSSGFIAKKYPSAIQMKQILSQKQSSAISKPPPKHDHNFDNEYEGGDGMVDFSIYSNSVFKLPLSSSSSRSTNTTNSPTSGVTVSNPDDMESTMIELFGNDD